jgi:hypothetical protein
MAAHALRHPALRYLTAGLLCLAPEWAQAHSFGQIYTLPLPIWLYLWGAAAALVASFVVVGLFVNERNGAERVPSDAQPAGRHYRLPSALLVILRLASLSGLMLCILTGWLGTPSPYGNFNMTFFWIVFILGFGYATALMGDLYALINPWSFVCSWMPSWSRGRAAYPAALGYWPALSFYTAMIWIELFGGGKPLTLSMALLAYSAITLAGVGVFGATTWFRYGEFFSVYFRLIAKMAPVEFIRDTRGELTPTFRLRAPLSGLRKPMEFEHVSLLLFVLFMLSSTAYDGLHETKPWIKLYWVDVYTQLLMPWVGRNPFAAYPLLNQIHHYWQSAWLILSPWIYLLLYLAGITLMWLVTGRRSSIRSLAMRFMLSLLPIVLVYHVTHYFTLIQTQGIKIIALISDPFGRGQNWFGTAEWFQGIYLPDTNVVWHIQVALMLTGHILSVWIAHLEALRCFDNRRTAVISQMPMLLLMVFFTTAGLWILAQPIQSSTGTLSP